MMKSYLRYEPSHSFGVICSPASNITYDFSGNLLLTSAVEEVIVWNARQANKVCSLQASTSNYPYSLPGEVTCIERSNDKSSVASGYSTGEIRIFNYLTRSVLATLRGHRSGISCLSYDTDTTSSLLASGGKDSDIYIWDMVSYAGLFKLRGHKDVVTAVKFLAISTTQRYLISVSKDTLLKVWDLATQHCVQTIVGHRSEIWTMGMHIYSHASATEPTHLIITGASDSLLRGYVVKGSSIAEGDVPQAQNGEENEILEYIGSLEREFGFDKCTGVSFNAAGTVLVAQSSGKNIEVYSVRDAGVSNKKMKRRLKRIREKVASGKEEVHRPEGGESLSVWEEEREDGSGLGGNKEDAALNQDRVLLRDMLEKGAGMKCTHRVRSVAFSPVVNKDGTDTLAVALLSNALDIYKLSPTSPPSKTSVIEMQGHRSDIRALALSSDGARVASCSAEGVKLWNVESGSCLSSALCGYGVSVAFAPGGRFIIVGTKEGAVQAIDTASGEIIVNNTEAHSGAVWSISVRPDGKGFATSSADCMVKFWDFSVVAGGKLGVQLSRELQMSHDALAVRFSHSKSQDKLLVAIGLLDNTIKVFFDDSLKFFLSLYGHKLPVMCLDISYDNTILISGSADKTIKIWGLDFGDCHRSLLAHSDSVTSVRFQPQTHYFFSTGKEGMVKYWDADRFEQILLLPGHCSCVWGIDISFEGAVCVSVGGDRTLRVWKRGEEMVFIEEEKERALEAQIDAEADRGASNAIVNVNGVEPTAAASADSAKGGERLMDAIDLVETEVSEMHQMFARNKPYKASNPLLLGKTPYKYMLHIMRQITANDMEQSLMILPFHYVKRFIAILQEIAKQELDVEVCTRCIVFLLRCHESAIISTQSLLPEISALQKTTRASLERLRALVGTNIAGLKFMSRAIEDSKQEGFTDREVDDPASQLMKVAKKNKKGGQKRKKST